MHFASMILCHSIDKLNSELQLEIVRKRVRPEAVSRLKGIFVFRDLESLERLWNAPGWDQHFTNEYLADVGFTAVNLIKVDSNWITRYFNVGPLPDDWEHYAKRYWLGEPCPGDDPIWEYIVDGRLIVWSMHSKNAAIDELKAKWPNSLSLLSYSMNSCIFGSLDGQCVPLLTFDGENICLDYYLHLADLHNKDYIKNLQKFIITNPHLVCNYWDGKDIISPYMKNYSRKIPINNDRLAQVIIKIQQQLIF